MIINNYLPFPYYAYYTPASASKIKLQKDKVVVVERSEQISTCGIQEKLRKTQAGWNGWVNMADR